MNTEDWILKKDILVSFIVPIYNVRKYVDKCIQSMLNIPDDRIEIILIDDGSSDGSGEVCDYYGNKDLRVRVVHQVNQGVSVARNEGIKISRGEWLCFVDGDDSVESTLVQELESYLKKKNDIVFFRFSEENGSKKVIKPGYCDDIDKEIVDFSYIQKATLNRYLCKYYVASPWAKLFRKDFLIQNNLEFVVGLKKAQDTLFVLEAYGKAKTGIFVNKALYSYNVHMESVSRKYNPEVVEIHNQLINELYCVVDDAKEKEELHGQLQVAIFRYLMASIQVNFCHVDNPKSFFQRKKEFEETKKMEVYQYAMKKADMSKCRFVERVLAGLIKMNFFWIIDVLFLVRSNINRVRTKFNLF